MPVYDVGKLIAETRRLAADYKRATGKSLAVSSEIARHDACELLQLELAESETQAGYDAIGTDKSWPGLKVQIKGRAIFDESKSGQRIGQVKIDKEWDAIALVLMNEDFETQEIYLAKRDAMEQELAEIDSKRQNRGAMTVARFKHIADLVWNTVDGLVLDVEENKSQS